MASDTTGRQLPVEVFIQHGKIHAVTERATVESWAAERAKAGEPTRLRATVPMAKAEKH